MKLICPSCSALLNVPGAAFGKLLSCPECGSKFVPNATHAAADDAAPPEKKSNALKRRPGDEEYEMDGAELTSPTAEPEYFHWKSCPNCGAPWKSGTESCAKCHFNARFDRVVVPAKKPLLDLRFNFQKFYLLVALGALGYALYWVINNWYRISAWIQSFWSTK